MKLLNNFPILFLLFFRLFSFVFAHQTNLDTGQWPTTRATLDEAPPTYFQPLPFDDISAESKEKLYSYEDIVEELRKVTEEFYIEFIQLRNMLPSVPPMILSSASGSSPNGANEEEEEEEQEQDGSLVQARRRRSINYDNQQQQHGHGQNHHHHRLQQQQQNTDVKHRARMMVDSSFVPDFIRDGIQLISQIVPVEDPDDDGSGTRRNMRKKSICSNDGGLVIDFFLLKFNHKQYALCLMKSKSPNDRADQSRPEFSIHYGPINNGSTVMYQYVLNDLSRPKRLLAFVNQGSGSGAFGRANDASLVVLVLNEKRTIEELNIKWIQINQQMAVIYQNHLKSLKRISYRNVAMWPERNMIMVHDIYEGTLKMFKFVRTYFDLVEFRMPVTIDLNAICAFTLNGVSYAVLGYRELPSNHVRQESTVAGPKDVTIYRYNHMDRLELIQSIQCDSNVLQIEYFSIGHGINQENFLAVVEDRHVVVYKFLKSKTEFLIFQRLPTEDSVRKIVAYGDHQRRFVMALIMQTNDIYFITYNSLRFIFSPINIRVYATNQQPISLKRIEWNGKRQADTETADSVQLMIGGWNGIRLYDVRFFRDNNLFKLWTEHLQWCHRKRDEISGLEKHINLVQKRYHESFLKTEPLVIRGHLTVPNYNGTVVEAKEYRVAKEDQLIGLNADYFQRLHQMKNHLDQIEQRIQGGHEKLAQALLINSGHVQSVSGNFSFEHLAMFNYVGNEPSPRPTSMFPATMNLITGQLNGQMIQDLFAQVINIRQTETKIMNPVYFKQIDLIGSTNQLSINGLCNERFNMSNIVTTIGNHQIDGLKRFHQSLIVDDRIITKLVDDKMFNQQTVLLTAGDQIIRNPVMMASPKLRAGKLNTVNVNGEDFDGFSRTVVKQNEPIAMNVQVEFADHLIVKDLLLDGTARMNGENFDELYRQALWLNKPDQIVMADCVFHSNLSIMANLNVDKINNRMLPDDFVQPNRISAKIPGQKVFRDEVFVQNLNVSQSINGLVVFDGVPDIVINDLEQNITGKKMVPNLSVRQSSLIRGLLNGMSLEELEKRSEKRPKLRNFERIHIENMARFEGGLWFDQINTLTNKQFERLVQESLRLDDSWFNSSFDHVRFEHLHANYLDCDSINGLDPINDLLTTKTMQTIDLAPNVLFQNDLQLNGGQNTIDQLNGYKLFQLNDVLDVHSDQTVNGTKVIDGDLYLDSLDLDSKLNKILIEDVVFDHWNNDGTNVTYKPVVGVKHFVGSDTSDHQSLRFSSITVDDLIVKSINWIHINELMENSLRRKQRQNISGEFSFNTLVVKNAEQFDSKILNDVNLDWLNEDVVLAANTGAERMMNDDRRSSWLSKQNVTVSKVFSGSTWFNQILFDHLMDGVTGFEMKHGWLVNGLSADKNRKIRANFSIDHLLVDNVHTHDSRLNGLNLDWLMNDLVWLDRKTSILSQIEFQGNVRIDGNILLNGRLNQMDLRKDLVLRDDSTGIQAIKGMVRLMNNVTINNDLEVNGLINNVDVKLLCRRTFRPEQWTKRASTDQQPLVINGNVDFWAPARFDLINGLKFEQIHQQALRHDRPEQRIAGKKLIDVLVLDGPTTMVNQFLNNLDLELVFNNYLSLTKDQEVETELVLKNVRFDGDVQVNQLNSDSDIVNGVNLARIVTNSLRQTGDQIYGGNIHFDSDVHVDLDLYAKWINGIGADYLMNKKRTVNTFNEEITFTESLHVRNNANVVNGKKISNVHVDRFLRDAVLQNSHKNYTIYGMKTFENVEVYILHTRPLNNVTFSRENLMLKNFEQTIRGRTRLQGDVWVNQTMATEKINDIDLGQLKRNLVKKHQDNVIKAKVRVKELVVKNAHVRSFIDNVNLTILDRFANTTNFLKHLGLELGKARQQMEMLQTNLELIGSRLIWFEQFGLIVGNDLGGNQQNLARPLIIADLGRTVCLFLLDKSNIFGCNLVQVYCNHDLANGTWFHSYKFHYPGTLLSLKQVDKTWMILASNIQLVSADQLDRCLRQNEDVDVGRYRNSTITTNNHGGIWFQSFRYLLQSNGSYIFYQDYHPMAAKSSDGDQIVEHFQMKLEQDPPIVLASRRNVLRLIHVGHDEQMKIRFPNRKTFQMEGHIKMVYLWNDMILVSLSDPVQRLEIYTLQSDLNLYKLHTIFNVRPSHMVMVENHQFIIESDSQTNQQFRNFLIFQESGSKMLQVFGTLDGVQYALIQEIQIGPLKSLQIYSAHIHPHLEPNLLMVHTCSQIQIYRLSGLEGFRWFNTIQVADSVMAIFNPFKSNLLYLFHGSAVCLDQSEPEQNYLVILAPKFRKQSTNQIWQEYSVRESSLDQLSGDNQTNVI